jgi:hypothetical protein
MVSRMNLESQSQEGLPTEILRESRRGFAGHDAAPPVIDHPSRRVVLALTSLAGLGVLLMCASLLVKWNVPLPRCAFKTVTGFPCFTCGATRALAALGRFEVLQALKFNPLITLACVGVPVWLGTVLLEASFAPGLHFRLPLRLKTILWLLAAAAIANWVYLLLELPK